MKPVAIFRHLAVEGPGYFATYLTQRDVPWRLVRLDEGEAVPGDPLQWSGLVAWCAAWGKEVESLARRVPSVQTPAQMTEAV